ncbi:lysophospholipid acyltransferase family protein [Terrihabitans sp. B22-R8]|uniref:lysophospholipid acyltransferase family protein n=1 Tax=Terrihabitans sp. B22-R8 TaxID=3425128 RepID=UPI00403CCE18
MLKKIGRTPFVLNALGSLFAAYVRVVEKTTRWTVEPGSFDAALAANMPVIIAMWHGQHVFAPIGWPKGYPIAALVARHADGEINAIAVEKLGVRTIRGAGGEGSQRKLLKRGGMQALRQMIRALQEGTSVAVTADVPKIGGVVGEGIVVLARLSGRPIYPVAVVTRRKIHFNSWDRATLSLPFGRGAMVLGEPVFVPSDADEEVMERARLDVGRHLNHVHARAYEIVGGDVWQDRDG